MVILMAIQMSANIINTVLEASQEVAMAALIPTLGQVLSLILVYILTLVAPPSLFLLSLCLMLSPICVTIFSSFLLYKNKFHEIKPSLKNIDLSIVSDLFSLGIKFFIIKIQIIILYQSTNFLISHISGPTEVSIFNISYKYMNVFYMVFMILLNPFWPAFTDAYIKNDFLWMKKIYKKLIFVYFIFLIIVCIMTFISPFFYYLWIGDKLHIPFIMTLSVALYTLIHAWDTLQVILINGIGKIKLQTYVTLIGIFLNIPLSLYLGSYIGSIGVVLSMSFIDIIYSIFFTFQIRILLNEKASGIWNK